MRSPTFVGCHSPVARYGYSELKWHVLTFIECHQFHSTISSIPQSNSPAARNSYFKLHCCLRVSTWYGAAGQFHQVEHEQASLFDIIYVASYICVCICIYWLTCFHSITIIPCNLHQLGMEPDTSYMCMPCCDHMEVNTSQVSTLCNIQVDATVHKAHQHVTKSCLYAFEHGTTNAQHPHDWSATSANNL